MAQRLVVRRRAGERGKFPIIEPHHRRPFRHQPPGERRARLRAVDKNRIQHPGTPAFDRRRDGDLRGVAPLLIEGAEIDQQPIGAGDELPISSGATVIDGMAPAASSTLAVKFCATELVMQWTRGRRSRMRVSTSPAIGAVRT